ncbi:MAG TPA: nicotinate-nucleotide adenylyltransferase [bacterium]|nr:nicotinate-nucleotide adenylyltransferase [bacterium]
MSERWGLFGGTFDPIHWGHLLLAEITRQILNLQKVFFIPARIPPHKGNVRASSEQRFRMTQLACEGNPYFEVSDVEIRREGPSYTVDTLRTFRAKNAKAELYLIIGADSAKDLGSWKDHETILEQSNVVVLARPDSLGDNVSANMGSRITILPTPLIELSSSEIRRQVHEGRSIRYLVTDSVEKYIRAENLYGPGKDSV